MTAQSLSGSVAIKFCGITRPRDAQAAVALGVQALGFILHEASPRAVAAPDARRIVAGLPPFVTPVAVLVNPTRAALECAVVDVRCRVVQVHGEAEPEALAHVGCPVLRAVRLGQVDGATVPEIDKGASVLIDAHDPVRYGGTGQTVDWGRAAHVARQRPVVLAGGLTPGNVADAIRAVLPYAVDVASGIEAAPGVKDLAKMEAFVRAVRSVA